MFNATLNECFPFYRGELVEGLGALSSSSNPSRPLRRMNLLLAMCLFGLKRANVLLAMYLLGLSFFLVVEDGGGKVSSFGGSSIICGEEG